MSAPTVRDIVREKYGQAALRAQAGGRSACCGDGAALRVVLRSDHFESLRFDRGGRGAGDRHQRLPRLRQSHCAGGPEAG